MTLVHSGPQEACVPSAQTVKPAAQLPGTEGFDDLRKAGVDYVYDAEDWETTWDVSDQEFIEENLQESGIGAVMTVSTLIQGPKFYAVRLVSERDNDGEPMDHEVRFYATYQDACVAAGKEAEAAS